MIRMSDDNPEGGEVIEEQAPPKNILKAEQIVAGLSQISKCNLNVINDDYVNG